MRWALARSDPETWLERDDADLISRNDGEFKHDLDRYKYPDRHHSDALLHRERGFSFLRLLDAQLSASGQLCGARRGLADAAIMPFVRQFAAVDRRWFEAQPIPHVQAWLAAHLASPLFAVVMEKVKPWLPGDPEVTLPGVDSGKDKAIST